MKIKMIGIDHTNTPLQYREKLYFSQTRAIQFLTQISKNEKILGSVIVATCNRTELWISYLDGFNDDLINLMCEFKSVDESYKKYFVSREGKDAVSHLFMLSCGLKSKILGEDQIISQIKMSVEVSRDIKVIDSVLEVLFKKAITASKSVKTKVKFIRNFVSVIDSAIKKIQNIGINIQDKKCLVIGNGNMGMLTVKTLLKNKVETYMTLREHHKGDVVVPTGVKVIPFSTRANVLKEFDIIFSTTSTNRYMITYDDVKQFGIKSNVIFVDLAVPRDIENKIFEIDGVIGFDIDSFVMNKEDIDKFNECIEQAQNILDEYIDDFYNWYFNKNFNIVILKIGQKVADDTLHRLCNNSYNDPSHINNACKKSVQKLMFMLRDEMDHDLFEQVISNIKRGYLDGEINE